MHPPAQMFGPRTKRNFLHSRLFLSDELGSERYTITFVEERGSDVRFTGIAVPLVTPGCTPAIAYNETLVSTVANNGDSMAAAHRVGLEGIQLALGCRSVVPCLK